MKLTSRGIMLERGAVPAVQVVLASLFPATSSDVWQRRAKTEYRRIVQAQPEIPEEGRASNYARSLMYIAALVVSFHCAAPEGVHLAPHQSERVLQVILDTPIASMILDGAQPFTELGLRSLHAFLAAGLDSRTGLSWAGEVQSAGNQLGGGASALVCRMKRCALADMCMTEGYPELRPLFCWLVSHFAALSGGALAFGTRIADGDAFCQIRCAQL